MEHQNRELAQEEIERRLLTVLCASGFGEEIRAKIFNRLAAHKFICGDHELVFRELQKIRRASAAQIQETLGARLTRLGFPDIDLEPIFHTEPAPADQIDLLLQRLNN